VKSSGNFDKAVPVTNFIHLIMIIIVIKYISDRGLLSMSMLGFPAILSLIPVMRLTKPRFALAGQGMNFEQQKPLFLDKKEGFAVVFSYNAMHGHSLTCLR
jgi:hypothetical protein